MKSNSIEHSLIPQSFFFNSVPLNDYDKVKQFSLSKMFGLGKLRMIAVKHCLMLLFLLFHRSGLSKTYIVPRVT